MRITHLLLIICPLFFAALLVCNNSVDSQSVSVSKAQPRATSTPEAYPQQLRDIFVDEDKLSYNGYDVMRLKKRVKYEYQNEKGEAKSDPIEISYAVVKRNNRTLAKFEGVYFGGGNATNFGLFFLLGGNSKQLIVSQTIPRGGRHWVVSLFYDFRVLLDSGDYGVGREEFSVIDVDKDGSHEISLPVTAFYSYSDVIATGTTPLPEILFKYDRATRKYLPANQVFQEYALRGIEQKIAKLDPTHELFYRARVMDIVLQYIYAGKEKAGWLFYDREYGLLDKVELRSRMKATLREQPVYRYIYRRSA